MAAAVWLMIIRSADVAQVGNLRHSGCVAGPTFQWQRELTRMLPASSFRCQQLRLSDATSSAGLNVPSQVASLMDETMVAGYNRPFSKPELPALRRFIANSTRICGRVL